MTESLEPPNLAESLRQIGQGDPSQFQPLLARPIFILSAGWRTGSTLLQRLVLSSGTALIWGEPFGEAATLRSMALTVGKIPRTLGAATRLHEGVPARPDLLGKQLGREWIANLYPGLDCLRQAHLRFWDCLLAEPAQKLGFQRWGFKEVRVNMDDALYLQWLYPDARFVFLCRNPYDAYLSFKRFNQTWYEFWPENPVSGPKDFGHLWHRLLTEFMVRGAEVNGMLLRFEDLKKAEVLEALSQHLELDLDSSVLKRRLCGGPQRPHRSLSQEEIELLREVAGPLAEELGYSTPCPAPSSSRPEK